MKRVNVQKKAVGRPSSFKPEFATLAFKLCLLGATDKNIADALEVPDRTLNSWKHLHPEFLQSLKEGREHADANVGSRLYERAIGYSHEAVKIFNHEGAPLVVPYTEHYPPDPTACIFWLKNRRPDLWRDRPDTVVNVTQNTITVSPEVYRLAREIAERDARPAISGGSPKQTVDVCGVQTPEETAPDAHGGP